MKMTVKKGFTIVELVIVIAVIAILATVLIPTLGGVIQKANDSKAMQEARIAYKEYMSKYAESGSVGSHFIFKADSKRYVAVIDGSPRGLYESFDKALDVLSVDFDDEVGYQRTSIKNFYMLNDQIVGTGDAPEDPTGFDAIKLTIGNKYYGDESDPTCASTGLEIYLRGGEKLLLKDRVTYEISLMTQSSTVKPGMVGGDAYVGVGRAYQSGWYGVMITKRDGSAFDFGEEGYAFLKDFVTIGVPISNPTYMSSNVRTSFKEWVYLEAGDEVKLSDILPETIEKIRFWNDAEEGRPGAEKTVGTDPITIESEGRYYFEFDLEGGRAGLYNFPDHIDLYDYVTITSLNDPMSE